jgi:hypothetical protein
MRNASAFISSTSKRASFRATHAPPDSHITPSCNINNSKQNKIRTAYLAACEYGQSLVRQ